MRSRIETATKGLSDSVKFLNVSVYKIVLIISLFILIIDTIDPYYLTYLFIMLINILDKIK